MTKDYRFEGENGRPTLADLFGDKQTLAVYSYMFGPQRERPCPMCTSLLSAWDGEAADVEQRIALAVVARSPIERLSRSSRSAAGATSGSIRTSAATTPATMSSADGRGHPGVQRLHPPRRHHPPFLERRDGDRDRRSRPGSARRARPDAALDHPRHDAGGPRHRLVSALELLAPAPRERCGRYLQIRKLMYVIARFLLSMDRRCFE